MAETCPNQEGCISDDEEEDSIPSTMYRNNKLNQCDRDELQKQVMMFRAKDKTKEHIPTTKVKMDPMIDSAEMDYDDDDNDTQQYVSNELMQLLGMTLDDIVNVPIGEFNRRLSKLNLTEVQWRKLRKERRRGRNRLAAQNSRRRRMNYILDLVDDIDDMREHKLMLLGERSLLIRERERMKELYQQLYDHIFQNLRDAEGKPYLPSHYTLFAADDGTVSIVQLHKEPSKSVQVK